MIHITDQQVKNHLTVSDARDVLLRAFLSHAHDRADIVPHSRAGRGFSSIGAAGALLHDNGVGGVTVSSSCGAKQNSCVALFNSASGTLSAVVDATRIRSVGELALTTLAAEHFSDPAVSTLGLSGKPELLMEHVRCILQVRPIARILVATESARRFFRGLHFHCRLASGEEIAACSDVILLAGSERAQLKPPLMRPGTLVIGVGRPGTSRCVVDEVLLRRASRIIVEWRPEVVAKAPELKSLSLEVLSRLPLEDLGRALAEPRTAIQRQQEITLFRSLGCGLSDVALAAHMVGVLCETTSPAMPSH